MSIDSEKHLQDTLITSDEIVRQIKIATERLTELLEGLYRLVRDMKERNSRQNEVTDDQAIHFLPVIGLFHMVTETKHPLKKEQDNRKTGRSQQKNTQTKSFSSLR